MAWLAPMALWLKCSRLSPLSTTVWYYSIIRVRSTRLCYLRSPSYASSSSSRHFGKIRMHEISEMWTFAATTIKTSYCVSNHSSVRILAYRVHENTLWSILYWYTTVVQAWHSPLISLFPPCESSKRCFRKNPARVSHLQDAMVGSSSLLPPINP